MDLFDLVAKITLDSSEYESGLDKASEKASGFGDKLKGGLATAGKLAVAGVAAAGTAAVAIGKQSLEAYANYEQLVGGVETLFKDSSGLVQEYAANAYQTAGLSANEYMETVTSFSASLLQSLGGDTEQAAKIGDMAITDMADNANKMGTSMEAIQNAYQGFAKQNYTMLDNLKLGYGGTKSEMERLLADATAISGVEYDIESLSDVYEAIHVIQTELDITGTTAKEASTTISGSLASMKSAWSNLLVGVADDNADFETLVGNFVDSVVTVGGNIIPRVESILDGLGELITQAADKLVPIVVETIINNLPKIIESGIKLVVTLISGLISAIPQLVQSIPQIIAAIIRGFANAWPQLKQAGVDLINMVGNGIKSLASEAWTWGTDLISNFIDGIWAKAQSLWDTVSGIGQGIRDFIGFSEPKEGPLSNFHTYAPDMMALFAKGIKDNEHLVTDQLAKSFSFESTITPNVQKSATAFGGADGESGGIINIVVQSVLDGRVIGETAYKYQRGMARAIG